MLQIDDQTYSRLVQLRHELHRLAELAGGEKNTSQRIKEELQQLSPSQIIEGVGGYGLIASFEGKAEGHSVMIRCELDALPIPEEINLEYASEKEGVSHKCGHDGHMAIVMGVASFLKENSLQKGNVYLLFQPSEETGEGAERILSDSKFRDLEPDYVFALHNLPGYPLHQVVLKEGTFASASRGFEVKLKGETAHAAHPEEGKSPALALASLIQSFSAFPQFFTSLDEAAKVTVINARLGEIAFGTSPGYAEFRATLRTYENELMQKLCNKAEQLIEDVAGAYQLEYDCCWTEIFEATVSNEKCNAIIQKAAGKTEYPVNKRETPFPWSEDFGRFANRYKGAMFGLGAGKDQPPLHASVYDFPDPLIRSGSTLFLEIINQITGFNS